MILTTVYPQRVMKAFASQGNGDFLIEDGILKIYTGNERNVIIPDTVTSIAPLSFSNCDSIVNIIVSESVTCIDREAFLGCPNLKSITIPDSVTTIGTRAFKDCSKLSDINLSVNAINIGQDAFANTHWLELKQQKDPIVVVNGILIDGSKCIGKVEIPDTVTCIGEGAFYQNVNMTSINIPDSVTTIKSSAFQSCEELKTVRMTDSVITIEEKAFSWCKKLENIVLSEGLDILEENLFYGCKALVSITIPQSVKEITASAFWFCRNLRYVTVSDNLMKAGKGEISAFTHCHEDLTFYGYSGSYMESFAKQYDTSFRSLKLKTTQKTLHVGETFTLKMNSLAKCIYKSSDAAIASVNAYGCITAREKGIVTITVNLYGKTYQCEVIVE